MAGLNLPGSGLLIDQANSGREEARLRQLGQRAEGTENREALAKSAREFEAVFMNSLLKAMRKTVPENKLFNSGGATKFYRQMHDAEIAKTLTTGHAGMGIADMIVNQFASHVDAEAAARAGKDIPDPIAAPTPLGPPAPQALSRYQSMSRIGSEVATRARMRGLAAAQGSGVADTLARFEDEIHGAAADSGLDPALILAVVMEESGGDPQARSHKGATGLMQLMPTTAAEVGVQDPTSPTQNLRGGAGYLARMLRRYDGRLDLALAAYNAGPGNVDKAGGQVPPFRETRQYVDRVLTRYQGLRGGTELANQP